uniref:GINS complex subunit 2 n=1 Tax=Meloidogyne hapla TaxID=6305 RepID=A0A1I8BGN8_MELHA
MVRVKQTFSDSKASCSSTTLQNYDGLKAPDKSGDTGSKLPSMDPSVCEFIAENELIQILPNFNERTIHLISGDFGPFEAGSPVTVPLWFALQLKYKHKCKIVPPEWLRIDELKKLLVSETERITFAPVPNCFFEIAHILVTNAYSDLEHVEQVNFIIFNISM